MTGTDAHKSELIAALERQKRVFQGNSSFLALVRGPDHVFEFANDAYLQLIGDRPCLGLPFREVLPEALQDGVYSILENVYRTGIPHTGANLRSQLNAVDTGTPFEVLVDFKFQPLRDAHGATTGVYIEGTNLTDRAQDEAALRFIREETERRRAELESLYESAPVGLALLGAERFEYRKLNRVQAQILNLSPDQVLGKTVRELTPSVADAAEELFRKVASGQTVRDVELEGDLPDQPGQRRSWIVSYAPIWLDGHVEAIICTALETTERKRAEQAAIQNEKLAAVGRLAGSIAHEINNPLEAVTNLLYLARNSDSFDSTREYIESAEMELQRVAAITTQTLRFHRQSTTPRTVTCEELLGSALAIYRTRLTGAGIRTQQRNRAGQLVTCFDGEIRQVLNNLVGNAADALIGHGGTLFLRGREGTNWRSGQAGLWLTVADTGTGMSSETLSRAFEPFYTTKGLSGTGLGLWISADIVKRHNGQLLVRSSQRPERSGTVMALFLPFEAVPR